MASLQGLSFKARYLMEGYLEWSATIVRFMALASSLAITRRYQPGDDLRHLDWRLYARSDRLCIKQHMQETNVRFYIVCEHQRFDGVPRKTTAWGF